MGVTAVSRAGLEIASPRSTWATDLSRRLVATDTAVVLATLFGAQGLRDVLVTGEWWSSWVHTTMSAVVAIAWLVSLHIHQTRDPRQVGVGFTEFARLANATFRVFGLFAIWMLITQNPLGRGYLLMALPTGLVMLMIGRLLWRRWLRRQRETGAYSHAVVLLGSAANVAAIAADLSRTPHAGYRVLGACVAEDGSSAAVGVPVLGGIDDVLGAMDRVGADTVVVTGSDQLPPDRVRQLGWQLDDVRYGLVVTPSMTDIGGPRVQMSPVAGLSLLHVDTPHYEGTQRFAKRLFDLAGSLGLLLLLGLPMLVVAGLIKLTSSGPVLFSHERIGRQGQPFRMYKFRSMRSGAETQLAGLLAERGTADQPLFKVVGDPRITPIGRVIRKYSIDELPQLLNVVKGDMSLVGPRPQVAGEVALYDDAAHRRHLVQPGMTGLWQVSGRSTLSWEDAIRLDLYYVENWSVLADVGILLRTVRAVVAPGESAH